MELYFMRLAVLLVSALSFNAYSGSNDFPCKPSDISEWEAYKYILCPLLTTVSIPFSIIAAPTGATIAGTSITGDINKNKIIIDSKPHAASYVASNSKIHSAYLEQALIMLRKEYPHSSDMELAKAILAY